MGEWYDREGLRLLSEVLWDALRICSATGALFKLSFELDLAVHDASSDLHNMIGPDRP